MTSMLLRLLALATLSLLCLTLAQAKTTAVDRRKVVNGETTTFYITNCHTSSTTTKTKSIPTQYSTTTKTYSTHTPETKIKIISKSSTSIPATVTITPVRYVQATIVATVTPTATPTTSTLLVSTDTISTVETTFTSTGTQPSQFTPLASVIAGSQGRRRSVNDIESNSGSLSKREAELEARSENCVKYPSKVKCCVKKNVLVPEKAIASKRDEMMARDTPIYTTVTITAAEVTKTLSPVSSTITLDSLSSGPTSTVTVTSTTFTTTKTTTLYTSTATVNSACERADNLVSTFPWAFHSTATINSISDTTIPPIKMEAGSAQECCNLCFSATKFNCQGSAYITTKDGLQVCYLYTSSETCSAASSFPILGTDFSYQYASVAPQYTLSNGPCSTFTVGQSTDSFSFNSNPPR